MQHIICTVVFLNLTMRKGEGSFLITRKPTLLIATVSVETVSSTINIVKNKLRKNIRDQWIC